MALLLASAACAVDGPVATPSSTASAALNVKPAGLTWTVFQGMRIPQGTAGPHNQHPVAPTGFDRTPTGAALAAMNATVRISVADDEQWPTISRLNVAPGPGRDDFAINRVQVSMGRVVEPGEAEQIVGYRVRSFTEDAANVDIITATPDGGLLITFTQVVWTSTADDWGLVIRDPGETNSQPRKAVVDMMPSDGIVLDT